MCTHLSSAGSLGDGAALSSGMEPETVLWGPDLQDPEQSPSTAHRGEGHQENLWARHHSGPSLGRDPNSGENSVEGKES